MFDLLTPPVAAALLEAGAPQVLCPALSALLHAAHDSIPRLVGGGGGVGEWSWEWQGWHARAVVLHAPNHMCTHSPACLPASPPAQRLHRIWHLWQPPA